MTGDDDGTSELRRLLRRSVADRASLAERVRVLEAGRVQVLHEARREHEVARQAVLDECNRAVQAFEQLQTDAASLRAVIERLRYRASAPLPALPVDVDIPLTPKELLDDAAGT